MSISSYFTKIGAAKVRFPVKLSSQLPNLSTLTFTASATNPADYLLNEGFTALTAGNNYYVMTALLGDDRVNGGVTWSAGSPVSGPITVSGTNPGILLNVAASNYPSGMANAYAMAVFLAKNGSDFALAAYSIIDRNGNDYNYTLINEPLTSQTLYTSTQLQSPTADYVNALEIGSRAPFGCNFSPPFRTTGGVNVQRTVDTVNVNPDNSTAYPQATARGTTITFAVLQNSMKNIVLANAGTYASYTVNGGHVVSTSNMSLQTAVALTTGNIPIQLIYPPDENRVSQVSFYLASVTTNPIGSNERWSKDSTTPLNYSVSTTNLDPLFNDVSVELGYKFKN